MKRIMIIDDELDILDVLERYLSRKYIVDTFSNPNDALNSAKSTNYDLILSDVMMPQVSGFDILTQLKEINKNLKVVLMTAYTSEERKERALQLHADKYLEKPFSSLSVVGDAISSLI